MLVVILFASSQARKIIVQKGLVVCCYVFCPPIPDLIVRKLAFHPPRKRNYSAYLMDRPTVEKHSAAKVVIFAQPNASDLGEYLQPFMMSIPMMAEIFNVDVYAFDYSGYGLSTGKPSERNVYADIRAIYDYVRKYRPDKKIVMVGYSIGTAVVADLASENPEGLVGVVFVAPFTSGIRLFTAQPANENSSRLDRFTTCDKVGDIDVPLLVCHGCRDEAIAYQHGIIIDRRAARPVSPLFLSGADHMTIFNGKYLETFSRIRM
ncbi:unnamed protein product [Nippostrongylus brasiliensis]|uniref:Mername-AA194 putative peptidase (inferred by orthology to a S. mansoni protein) n=1 Tax=Nippostrongylus brasiliensis TaxID=27835 RepID=A0A0N4YEZ0_NIPBR|nr:unnamed protein product [Nippostrongylus brasiliensis]